MADTLERPAREEEQESDRIRPWTIRGIPPEERNAALAAAEREDVAIGEWMRLAIRTKIKADRGAKGKGSVAARGGPLPPMDVSEMKDLVALVVQMREATGEPPPKSVTATVYARLRERLKAPVRQEAQPSPTAAPAGQTVAAERPTAPADGQTGAPESPTGGAGV
ncbi:hypothetical protein MHL39_10640 [Roseomonas mucosa]|uniref:hypothetical protein n=1 Tax=Roseomonas mucosa TaxID=207340 RepID=UPI001EF6725B|nr:hypothetical protein [Roseomonas mucosa]MCG7357095.1 hypothetical protein [Roseomonas mucosa]